MNEYEKAHNELRALKYAKIRFNKEICIKDTKSYKHILSCLDKASKEHELLNDIYFKIINMKYLYHNDKVGVYHNLEDLEELFKFIKDKIEELENSK